MNEILTMLLRMTITVVLASIIGLERETRNTPAGLRTHILVSVGACMLMLLSLYGFDSYTSNGVSNDLTRIPAYVVSGLGFLGAGTIIVNKGNVRGLTTAASVWIVASIGLVVGAGLYELAVIGTFLVFISLTVLQKINDKINSKREGDKDG